MKSPADYQNTILETITEEWHLLAKRMDAPILPLIYKFYVMASPLSADIYNTRIRTIAIWRGNNFELYLNGDDYRKAIESGTKILFSDDAEDHINGVIKYCEKSIEATKRLRKLNLQKLSDQELLDEHNKVIEPYTVGFINGFITWCAQIAQEEALSIIEKHREDIPKELNQKETFSILVSSPYPTVSLEKEQFLNDLSNKFKGRIHGLTGSNRAAIEVQAPEIDEQIKLFLQKYDWVGYDYGGPAVTYEEVVKTLFDREVTEKETEISKSDLIKKLKLSENEKSIFRNFSLLSNIKELRNTSDDILHYTLDFLYAELGKRHQLSGAEIRTFWPEELEKFVAGKADLSTDYLSEKFSCAVAVSDVRGNWKFLVGEDAAKFAQQTIPDRQAKMNDEEVVKGMVASSGKVAGIARIIRTFADSDKVEKGDILIASMTSPRLMNAIIKSGAIVTDEGGMTCHAAIIARELRKPCIIGTKFATKILKDGDLVEVDADKGIVRKI